MFFINPPDHPTAGLSVKVLMFSEIKDLFNSAWAPSIILTSLFEDRSPILKRMELFVFHYLKDKRWGVFERVLNYFSCRITT